MTFEVFKNYLTTDHRSDSTGLPFGQHAAIDYPSRLRRMERLLDTSLENAPPMVLRSLAVDLRTDPRVKAQVSPKVMGDLARALREYADFLDGPMGGAATEPKDVPLALSSDTLIAELRNRGFGFVSTRSTKMMRFSLRGLTLYVRSDTRLPLVVHPVFQDFFTLLAGIPGTIREGRQIFYHNANLSKFPRRDDGQGLIHYGIAFGFASVTALQVFITELQRILSEASPIAPEKNVSDVIREVETENSVMAKARIGQGRFRADLLNFWQGQCALTDVAAPELLRASHIKPWKDSSDRERLDAFNGLLLAVHLDVLFDRTLITFEDSGDMLVSKRLSASERAVFGLMAPQRKLLLNVPHLGYLHHHQDRFGANEQKN